MRISVKAIAFLMMMSLAACASTSYREVSKPFPVVSSFDAAKYLGKWYQIARYPAWYEQGCFGDIAEYALINESEVRVINSCNQGSLEGGLSVSKGKARIEKPGVLTVTFFGSYPKEPNYYVMAIKGDYEIAVVGEPDGTSGWILARTPQISDADYQWATGVLSGAGYDLSELYKTPQPTM